MSVDKEMKPLACIMHAGIQCACCACRNRAKGGIDRLPLVASIMLGFLPLNHLMGRMSVLQCLSAGGTMTFVRPQFSG